MDRAAASPEHTEQLCRSTWSSGSLGADTDDPPEHMEQGLSGADTAAPVEHYGVASLEHSELAVLEHMEQRLSESRYSCSNGILWSSYFPGAHIAGLLEHMEQRLPWSTESSYAGARGAVALWEQMQVLLWSTWSSSSFPRVHRAALLVHMPQWSC